MIFPDVEIFPIEKLSEKEIRKFTAVLNDYIFTLL